MTKIKMLKYKKNSRPVKKVLTQLNFFIMFTVIIFTKLE